MTHVIFYLGEDPAAYEAAALTLFQKHPPSRADFSITIYEKGKAGGQGTKTELWPGSAKSIHGNAKQMAAAIVAERKRFAGSVIDRFAVDF
jgi:hypothetical protein